MVESYKWIMGLNYKLGVDGISILFVMLTTFMMPLVIWASWSLEVRVKEYMIAFLLLFNWALGYWRHRIVRRRINNNMNPWTRRD